MNKYTRWYDGIITQARVRQPQGYTERHHIVPKCMGGSDQVDNIVRLTPREHFIAHCLLVRMTTGTDRMKMLQAVTKMKSISQDHVTRYVNARLYASARDELAAILRDPVLDADRRLKIKAGYTRRRELGLKKILTESHKQAIGAWNVGRKHQVGIPEQIGVSSRATFARMKLEGKQRWADVTCPHCNLQGRGPNMTRYHFDSCKRRAA